MLPVLFAFDLLPSLSRAAVPHYSQDAEAPSLWECEASRLMISQSAPFSFSPPSPPASRLNVSAAEWASLSWTSIGLKNVRWSAVCDPPPGDRRTTHWQHGDRSSSSVACRCGVISQSIYCFSLPLRETTDTRTRARRCHVAAY